MLLPFVRRRARFVKIDLLNASEEGKEDDEEYIVRARIAIERIDYLSTYFQKTMMPERPSFSYSDAATFVPRD
jgi:hypothetical protein